ncbi:MAG TPA: M3 family metallopeptidase [Candidatus Cryptobacteroides excrementigallinarum]|nr:M3 family metallopeptidase [Candidatus Cryptobacteroides excrementigallinarum]
MKRIISIISIALIMTACSEKNPFLAEWDTPYGIPPYEEIEVGDYIPAIQKGIEQQNAEIEAITSNPDTPTFENTIVPLELSGDILSKVTGVLYNVSETDRSDSLDAVVAEALPLLSGHSDNIAFNKALYNRVAAIYEADQSGLTREQQVVLKKYYDDFRRNGIDLPEETQDRLREINSEIATKTQQIGNNILAESNAFAEKFGFSVSEYPSKMTTTEDRELRRQYNEAYTSRGANGNEYDNSSLILDVMKLRIEKAKLLGYDTPADYILSDKMAGSPERVDSFLSGIMTAAVAKAREELADMQVLMDEDVKAGLLPEGSKIEPWDWWYYAEKVRKARYDLDENEVRSYFNVDRVRDGIFRAAQILYGINAEKIDGVPVYNPGVDTYKITDADGSFVGIFTTDYFPRASKRGGAWMNNVRQQYVDAEGNDVRPIIVNVGNLSENMNIDEVQTVFHEFGHALHGLLSKCTYPSVSGTNVTRDYVEMFSQFNENWAFQPDLLAVYAKNSDGEVIPVELVEKINNSLKFNQGFMTTELCAAAILDMKWHELESVDGIDVAGFEKKVCEEMGLIPEIAPRYRTTYFNHIFSSGYEAGYYGYLWAEVLDKDAFSAFLNSPNGTWDLGLARKFREIFLERGGSEEPMELYKEFMGREPDSRAMLLGRGLLSEDTDE